MITEDFSLSIALGQQAPDFDLLDTDGVRCSLDTFGAARFLVLQFTCNHCPYVLGSDERLASVVASFEGAPVAWVGICSNDAERYPQDSYPRMQERAGDMPYRYLHDPTQGQPVSAIAACHRDWRLSLRPAVGCNDDFLGLPPG